MDDRLFAEIKTRVYAATCVVIPILTKSETCHIVNAQPGGCRFPHLRIGLRDWFWDEREYHEWHDHLYHEQADIEFAVHARQDILALVAEVERVRDGIDQHHLRWGSRPEWKVSERLKHATADYPIPPGAPLGDGHLALSDEYFAAIKTPESNATQDDWPVHVPDRGCYITNLALSRCNWPDLPVDVVSSRNSAGEDFQRHYHYSQDWVDENTDFVLHLRQDMRVLIAEVERSRATPVAVGV